MDEDDAGFGKKYIVVQVSLKATKNSPDYDIRGAPELHYGRAVIM
jgi:hypothetical protein